MAPRRRTAVAVCGACGAAGRPLQCLARGGELHSACQVCFLAQEISALTSALQAGDATLSLTVEGLTVLYQTVRAEVEAGREDASESARGTEGGCQGEGQAQA